jgi:hypothetical protein
MNETKHGIVWSLTEEKEEEEEGSWIHFTVVYIFSIRWSYFGILR